jgi:hypothetical protein
MHRVDRRETAARRVLGLGLIFFAATHALGLVAMATVLRPGMDPNAALLVARMAYVSQHVPAWRLGWLPWQLSAASDLWVSIALVSLARARSDRLALRIALAALALDLIAALPEQWAEAALVTSFPSIDDEARWRAAWSLYAGVTGVWANGFYTLMTGAWMFVARRVLGRRVFYGPIEIAMLVLFTVAGVFTYLACTATTDAETARFFAISTIPNGLAFPLLTLWSIVLVLRLRQAAREEIAP